MDTICESNTQDENNSCQLQMMVENHLWPKLVQKICEEKIQDTNEAERTETVLCSITVHCR